MRDSTLAGAAWGGLWPKNHGRKAKPLAQCHGTTLFFSIKAAGESTPQLPWHRLCVRFDVVFSLASMDSCFHLSVPRMLLQRLRVITRKWVAFFVSSVSSWFPRWTLLHGISLPTAGHSTCLFPGHQEAGFDRNKTFPPFPSCDPSLKMRADCSFLTPFIYHLPCPMSPVASGTTQLTV